MERQVDAEMAEQDKSGEEAEKERRDHSTTGSSGQEMPRDERGDNDDVPQGPEDEVVMKTKEQTEMTTWEYIAS